MKLAGVVQLGAVRLARARIDALMEKYPQLREQRGDGVAGWLTTLEREEAMAEETEQVAFRLPKGLVERLDVYAAGMAAEHAGMKVTRTDVVRLLLTRALDAADTKQGKKGR